MNTVELHNGDCLAVLMGMPSDSIDAIVTDPPYGLSFMGKRWDYDVPSVEVWAECLRVLKPGGHLLAFAGTRTQHRMAVRIEDAGFEIRDMIAWVYGSGFPKSLDVSRAIDKARTEDLEPIRVVCRAVRAAMDAKGLKSRDLTRHFGDCHPRLVDHWAARDTDSQPSLPTWEQWGTLREVLGMGSEHDAEVWRLNGRKGQPGDTWQNAEVIGEHEGATPGFGEHRFEVRDTKIRAASETAAKWQGWGTALKPALEPITVARKPLAGTVAENVLRHGTGGLNIDGCRVEPQGDGDYNHTGNDIEHTRKEREYWRMPSQQAKPNAIGRWPANLIHDGSDEVLAGFPDSNGSGAARTLKRGQRDGEGWGMADQAGELRDAGTGSAARFFQTCKGVYDSTLWPDLNLPPERADTAGRILCPQRQHAFSVLGAVASEALPEAWSLGVSLSALPTMSATGSELKKIADALTQTIRSIGSRFWLERAPGGLSLSLNPVQSAVLLAPTGTMTITLSHWKSDGSAEAVTFSITPTNSEVGARGFEPFTAGGGARFKYCAKASRTDRNEGCEGMPSKMPKAANGAENAVSANRGSRSGPRENHHPTVKPTDLMRYLCRLVTPPGGVVLDPFTGSGSTGKAAILEGFRFIGIEREAEYVEIARARIQAVMPKPEPPTVTEPQLALFP